jgi:mono/diheme cytochrome c family protein
MRRLLRMSGFGLGGLLVLIAMISVSVYAASSARLNRTYTFTNLPLAIPSDAASIARGQHLVVAIAKCADCHTADLSGGLVFDAPPARIIAANLTRGTGGIGAQFSDADWVRAIRHGVGPDGKPLLFMPSQVFAALSDPDLADIIAYVKSVPPVDRTLPASAVKPLGRMLLLMGQVPLLPAEMIDHAALPLVAPPRGVTKDYGRYLAVTGGCTDCHGGNLSGRPISGAPPEFPPAANLTPGGDLAHWSDADIVRALREGARPDGSVLNPFMPWKATRSMTDDEIAALIRYLRSIPARSYHTHE